MICWCTDMMLLGADRACRVGSRRCQDGARQTKTHGAVQSRSETIDGLGHEPTRSQRCYPCGALREQFFSFKHVQAM